MVSMVAPDFLCEPTNRHDPIESVRCDANGKPCLNGAKSYEKWYQGGFIGTNNSWAPTVPANQTQVLTLRATAQDNNAGNLVLSQLVMGQLPTSRRLAVRLYSQWLDRAFSNVAIPIDFLFGTPNYPGLLMGSLFVKAGTALKAETTDLSGSDNTCYLMARGFRNLIGPGYEAMARQSEVIWWEKFRRFLPFFLGPDVGPQVPAAGSTALASSGSQTITFTCPSDGDFYMVGCYLMGWNATTGFPFDASNFTIVSWSESGPSSSFIDPANLPLRADNVFSFSEIPDSGRRACQTPGGWGGDLWNGEGQWIHRLHRGTVMTMVIQNNTGVSVRLTPVFVGYLATCDSAPGEFLAFPPGTNQQTKTFTPILPGDPSCGANCAPNQPASAGRVIVAPQAQTGPGGMRQGVGGLPLRSRMFRGGQSW